MQSKTEDVNIITSGVDKACTLKEENKVVDKCDKKCVVKEEKSTNRKRRRNVIIVNKENDNKLHLKTEEKDKITSGQWLSDEHISLFHELLKQCSDFEPRPTWYVQNTTRIKPLDDSKKTHLQLLFSVGSHWVCCYYDSRKIIIYDSYEVTRNLNRISPDSQIIIFLKALFPFYDFQNIPVQFPEVQNQQNGRDCGLFAMAFAI